MGKPIPGSPFWESSSWTLFGGMPFCGHHEGTPWENPIGDHRWANSRGRTPFWNQIWGTAIWGPHLRDTQCRTLLPGPLLRDTPWAPNFGSPHLDPIWGVLLNFLGAPLQEPTLGNPLGEPPSWAVVMVPIVEIQLGIRLWSPNLADPPWVTHHLGPLLVAFPHGPPWRTHCGDPSWLFFLVDPSWGTTVWVKLLGNPSRGNPLGKPAGRLH
jgi:hypothetical protein